MEADSSSGISSIQQKSKVILPIPEDHIRLASERNRSKVLLIDESTPDLEQEENRTLPDFTSLAMGQIQMQSSLDLCSQTLRAYCIYEFSVK